MPLASRVGTRRVSYKITTTIPSTYLERLDRHHGTRQLSKFLVGPTSKMTTHQSIACIMISRLHYPSSSCLTCNFCAGCPPPSLITHSHSFCKRINNLPFSYHFPHVVHC